MTQGRLDVKIGLFRIAVRLKRKNLFFRYRAGLPAAENLGSGLDHVDVVLLLVQDLGAGETLDLGSVLVNPVGLRDSDQAHQQDQLVHLEWNTKQR